MLDNDSLGIPSHQLPGGRPTTADLYALILRVDAKVDRVEGKVDKALEFRTQFFAVMGVVKWLGPGGLAVVILAMLALAPH
jgi:hypothetical protein